MKAALEELAIADRKDLIEFWEETLGSSPPPSTSQDMMRLIIGWELQAKTSRADVRALKAATKKLLRPNMTDGHGGSGTPLIAAPVKVDLSQGTRLSREWNGSTYIVDVLDKGYAYDGKLFTSLSPIAKAITGTHRSGPLFFGVSR